MLLASRWGGEAVGSLRLRVDAVRRCCAWKVVCTAAVGHGGSVYVVLTADCISVSSGWDCMCDMCLRGSMHPLPCLDVLLQSPLCWPRSWQMAEQARLVNELKEVANQSLAQGAYSKALRLYTRAIEADAGNAVLYSNRAAAHYQAGQYQESLEDAESAILCDESWWKGHKRKAQALVKLDRIEDAVMALEEGIAAAPDASELATMLVSTRSTLERLQTMYVLPGPEMMKKLDSVPVFLVTDQEGQPFFITYDDGTQACTIYFDPTDAQATLEWIQKENGPQGEKAILAPLSLTQAFALAQDTQQQYLDDEASATAAALKKTEQAAKAAAAAPRIEASPAAEEAAADQPEVDDAATDKPKDEDAAADEPKDEGAAVDEPKDDDTTGDKPEDADAADDKPKDDDAADDKPVKVDPKPNADAAKVPEKEPQSPLAFQFRPELRQVEAAVVLLKAMPPVGEDGLPLPKPAAEEAATDKKADVPEVEAPVDPADDATPATASEQPPSEPTEAKAEPESAAPASEEATAAADGDAHPDADDAQPVADAKEGEDKEGETTEDAPTEDSPKGDSPKGDSPNEDSPKEDSPKEDSPEEDSPEEDAAKEDAANEDAPEEDAPEEDAPEEDAPKEDALKEDAPKESTSIESASKEDVPKEDVPKEDTPNEDPPMEDAAKEGAADGEEELTVDNFSGIPVFQAKGLTLLQNNQQNVPLFFSKWDLEKSWSQLAASNPGEPLGDLEIDVGTLEDVLRRMAESKTKEFDPVIFVPSREALKYVGREFPLEDLTGIKPPPPPKAMSEQGPPPKNLLQLAKMMAASGASTDEIREAVRAKLVETKEQQRLQEFLGPAGSKPKKAPKASRVKKATGTDGSGKGPNGKAAVSAF